MLPNKCCRGVPSDTMYMSLPEGLDQNLLDNVRIPSYQAKILTNYKFNIVLCVSREDTWQVTIGSE